MKKAGLVLLLLFPLITEANAVEGNIRVPFYQGKFALGPAGTISLQNAMTDLRRADRITIQGRPDPTAPSLDLAHRRSLTVKSQLINAGIPEYKIFVEDQSEPSFSDIPNAYNVTLLTEKRDNKAVGEERPAQMLPTVYATAAKEEPMVPVSVVRRILKTGMEDNLSANAINRLFDLMVSVNYAATPKQPETSAVYAPAAKKTIWKVDANKTLKDNIEAWSTTSGWEAPHWKASNLYQVSKSTTIEGEFPDVLKQIADSTGLNICVTRNPKNISITDPNVSCKE